jgi:hypothetical protein
MSDSRTHCVDLADENHPWRHDSNKLAAALMTILDEFTGPLDRDYIRHDFMSSRM